MYILNTRPTERAASLTHDLQALGYDVIEYPLLELSPLALSDELIGQFLQFDQVDTIVVVSPIAAEIGLRYAELAGIGTKKLKSKQWVAVGRATQHRLLAFGFESICPEIETSEGMLTFDLFDKKGQTIAFWRGIGGRTFMMEHLIAQGLNVINMLLYTRSIPKSAVSFNLEQYLESVPQVVVLISSEQSFYYWLELQQPLMQQKKMIYVVLGDRVSTVVKSALLERRLDSRIVTIYDLQAQTIHQQLKQFQ